MVVVSDCVPSASCFRSSSSLRRASLRYPFVAGNRNATSWLFIHKLMDVWVVFIFIIVNNATVNNCAQDFVWTCVSISLGFGARNRRARS